MDDERLGRPVGLSSLLLHMGRNAADKQLARGDITQDEYDEIIKILYPPLSLVQLICQNQVVGLKAHFF